MSRKTVWKFRFESRVFKTTANYNAVVESKSPVAKILLEDFDKRSCQPANAKTYDFCESEYTPNYFSFKSADTAKAFIEKYMMLSLPVKKESDCIRIPMRSDVVRDFQTVYESGVYAGASAYVSFSSNVHVNDNEKLIRSNRNTHIHVKWTSECPIELIALENEDEFLSHHGLPKWNLTRDWQKIHSRQLCIAKVDTVTAFSFTTKTVKVEGEEFTKKVCKETSIDLQMLVEASQSISVNGSGYSPALYFISHNSNVYAVIGVITLFSSLENEMYLSDEDLCLIETHAPENSVCDNICRYALQEKSFRYLSEIRTLVDKLADLELKK